MISRDLNRLRISTPEGISFSFILAGPVTRGVAWIVDSLVIGALSKLAGALLGLIGLISPDFFSGVVLLAYFAISMGYGIWMEWRFRGQTLGKRLFKLRVMDDRGLHLEFSQVVIRNLLRFIDTLPVYYLVGGLACLINRKAKRLGDLAANTVVVWSPGVGEPDLDKLLRDKYNSFRRYPHLEARLRQKTSPREAGVALQALMRRDELDPAARIELFRDIADYFKAIVAFPQEAVEGISDEQVVRNVVEALYRARGSTVPQG
jgi:uncharacterized RDD family membrane protein YckC